MQYTPIRSYQFYDVACFDPVTATIASVGMTAASTAVSAAGTLAGGDAAMASAQRQQQQAEFKAKQEEQAAQQGRALAQRAALDKRQEGVMAASRAQAMFAHSGGGAADPTALNVTGRLSGRNELDALLAMFKGESEARGREDQARSYRMAGEAALADGAAKQSASKFSALSTILGGASSIFGQIGKMPGKAASVDSHAGIGSNDSFTSSSGSYGGNSSVYR
jgi:hypothetical protein